MTSSQVEGFVRSTGCLSSYAWRVVLSHQLHRGWVVASGRQVMYWALRRKRPLHSSAYRLILQWGRALRFDTAQAEAVHRSSGHAISQLLSRNKSVVSAHAQVSRSGRKRRSPNLYGRCTHVRLGYCTGHTPFSLGHATSQLL